MRVMHVGGPDIGLRLPMMCRLAEEGFEIAAVGSGNGASFAGTGIPFFYYPLQLRFTPWGDLQAARALVKVFREFRPDVVHAFHTKPSMIATIAAVQASIPIRVRTITGLGRTFASKSLRARAIRPLYCLSQALSSRLASATVFQNKDDQKFFLDYRLVNPQSQLLVPGSGIDISALDDCVPSEEGKAHLREDLGLDEGPIILMASRMVRYKGIIPYLEAAREVKRRRPEVQFLLAGARSEDPKQAVPEDMLQEYSDCVRVLGFRRDLPAILSLADAVTLPTYYREGVPRILLEAAALSRPLITTDMPGCRDVVVPEVNGLLVPPRNAEALAEAVLRLLDKPAAERVAMGRMGRRRIEKHFTLDGVATTCGQLYQKLYKANLTGGDIAAPLDDSSISELPSYARPAKELEIVRSAGPALSQRSEVMLPVDSNG